MYLHLNDTLFLFVLYMNKTKAKTERDGVNTTTKKHTLNMQTNKHTHINTAHKHLNISMKSSNI